MKKNIKVQKIQNETEFYSATKKWSDEKKLIKIPVSLWNNDLINYIIDMMYCIEFNNNVYCSKTDLIRVTSNNIRVNIVDNKDSNHPVKYAVTGISKKEIGRRYNDKIEEYGMIDT
ncbi:MAG: hypothetical protein PHF61_09340 [Bacteroidales bacterium]|jgi:hypothetical protein|nr:hypothetical protein [Bacteroidales bacterium]MDD4431588.1 hypothetical protein [Bacteroidales bacterium]